MKTKERLLELLADDAISGLAPEEREEKRKERRNKEPPVGSFGSVWKMHYQNKIFHCLMQIWNPMNKVLPNKILHLYEPTEPIEFEEGLVMIHGHKPTQQCYRTDGCHFYPHPPKEFKHKWKEFYGKAN